MNKEQLEKVIESYSFKKNKELVNNLDITKKIKSIVKMDFLKNPFRKNNKIIMSRNSKEREEKEKFLKMTNKENIKKSIQKIIGESACFKKESFYLTN